MKRTVVSIVLAAAFAASLGAQGLVELFQKAKGQVKAGSWAPALSTLDALDAESRKPGAESQRAQLEPVLAFYRGVCLASLDKPSEAQSQFELYLATNPNASLDASAYSKKVVRALEDARKGMGSRGEPVAGLPSLASSYREFKLNPSASVDPPREDWSEGPVRVLLTSEQKRDWSRLSDPVARSEFVTKFWATRDPKPETPANEFREEFEKRVAFADKFFGQGETRGSLTDRGMVFLLLGPPTYAGRRPIRGGEDSSEASGNSTVTRNDVNSALAQSSNAGKTTTGQQAALVDRMTGPGTSMTDSSAASWREVWHYRKELLPPGIPYQQVDLDFITRKGYGENVLQRDPASLTTLEAARRSPTWSARTPEKGK
jgi:GWxTD domain-containing protein